MSKLVHDKALVVWIYHDIYHAFAIPKEHERGEIFTSACGRHVTRNQGTKCMGAAECLECAEALGIEIAEDQKPGWQGARRGLGYAVPSDASCSACEREREAWTPLPDTVGTTNAGLLAPQSAIDAMRRRGS